MTNALRAKGLSGKAQALSAALAVLAAVALPQIFHVVGAASGLGTGLGEAFLPMHLPVFLAALLAGPMAGLAAGVFSPLLSFFLSGMPGPVMLPFITLELAGYGLAAGLLRSTRLPVLGKVLLTQVAGRALRSVAVLAAVYGLGSQTIGVASVWNSIMVGLPGILLQWCILPLTVFWVEHRGRHD